MQWYSQGTSQTCNDTHREPLRLKQLLKVSIFNKQARSECPKWHPNWELKDEPLILGHECYPLSHHFTSQPSIFTFRATKSSYHKSYSISILLRRDSIRVPFYHIDRKDQSKLSLLGKVPRYLENRAIKSTNAPLIHNHACYQDTGDSGFSKQPLDSGRVLIMT